MRNLLLNILNLDGHQTITVASAEEGLEQLPFYTFQVAFLDHNLPGMEGLVLGEYLRRNNPHMQVALVTGETDRRLERMTRERSITFIAKPFDVKAIRDVVDDYRVGAASRLEERLQQSDPHYSPGLDTHFDELTGLFAIRKVPVRLEERLVERIRSSLNNLRSVSRYNERDRVVAWTGLITAQVLGIDLPRGKETRTLFEEYDMAMRHHGRRVEFERDES